MRAVYLAFLACAGQPQAPTVRMQPNWRFYDVLFSVFSSLAHLIRGSWENVIFKMNTAEGHSMTAVELLCLLATRCSGEIHHLKRTLLAFGRERGHQH